VPSKRKAGNRLLEEALEALVQALEEAGAPWMIIGGIAIIARGVRRFTTDIDAAVRGDAVSVARLAEVLAAHGIVGRIPDAVPFAQANMVLLVRHASSGVDLDVTFAWSEFEHEALSAAQLAKFGRVTARMTTPEDLVVFKAFAARPRDLEDLDSLVTLHPGIDLARARRRLATLAEAAEAPEVLARFDAFVARLRK
jgi:hypothetical protein